MTGLSEATGLNCDVAVVGAGTAGLAAARRAVREGAKVYLIDERFDGTMCANVGCMPSKLLIAAASAAEDVRRAGTFGLETGPLRIDGPAVMQRLRAERDRFARLTREGFDDFPPHTMIRARATFTGETTLTLDDGRKVEARAIVIATGGRPIIPDDFKAVSDLCLTHETVFELTDLPDSLAVIGAGPIGLELAQAFARLGVRTALFDESDALGEVQDSDLQRQILTAIGKDVSLHLGVKTQAERDGRQAKVNWSGNSQGSEAFERVLIATGRPPQLDGLGLDKTGIALDKHGVPLFDRESMQCGTSSIFIAGDADRDVPVLHEASAEGGIAGLNAARYPDVTRTPRMTPFSMIFCQPVLAKVGQEPDEASITGSSDYSDQGRARVEGEGVGSVIIHAEPTRGRLTGAVLFCPGAEHLAHLLVQAISHGITASEMLAQPFYHPTLEEGLRTALRAICSKIPASGDYDRSVAPGG
jgi:dihydrolipoamide dehydrogenase